MHKKTDHKGLNFYFLNFFPATKAIIEVINTKNNTAKAIQRTIGFHFVIIKHTAQIAISTKFMITEIIKDFLEISIITLPFIALV